VHKNIGVYTGLSFAAGSLGAIGLGLALAICFFKKNKPKYTWEKYRKMAM